jgi:hypothetical protein
MTEPDEILFEVETPLGFTVRSTKDYWIKLSEEKHPILKGNQALIEATLQDPDEIRRSRKDTSVYLFYRTVRLKRWVCAVTKASESGGYLITAYISSALKQGEILWTK